MRHFLLIIALLAGDMANGSAFANRVNDVPDSKPYRVAIQMEQDRRVTLDEFAKHNHMDRAEVRRLFGASGLVRCQGSVGTAQLTMRADVITTAAHVLIGADGRPRQGCRFESNLGSAAIAIDMTSVQAGSRRPLAEPATRDWAVARLAAPVKGAAPYRLAAAGALPASIMMFAGGNRSATAMGAEQCRARHVISTAATGIREVAIDCNAAPGSSGAALVDHNGIVAVYVGYRSTHPNVPQGFSEQHYNFAITVDGPFREAVLAVAR